MGIALLVAAPLTVTFVLGGATPTRADALAVAPTPTQPHRDLEAIAAADPSAPPNEAAGQPVPNDDLVGADMRRVARTQRTTGYRWPVRNARLTQPFGPSPIGQYIVDGAAYHDGLDLATFCGDRITAAHAGTVLAAGRNFDAYIGWVGDLTAYTARLNSKHLWLTLPNVVVIDDGNGYRSVYAHLYKVSVAPGDIVKAGDQLGTEGATGNATGCHLHYSLFSPEATSTFGFDPKAAARMLLPTLELARINPLLVLPPMADAGIR